jgi:hypothetical protein
MWPRRAESLDWNHSTEYRLLQEENLQAAKFKPEDRPLYRTLDMEAFAGEVNSENGDRDGKFQHTNDDAKPADAAAFSNVPSKFPPHRLINGIIELSGYLASSSYIVSLGGPPLPDLKYGVIVVPAGDEELLFVGYGDDAVMPVDLRERVYAKSKAAQKEQLQEHRQKIEDEIAKIVSGVGVEPELDDDDHRFYRRRWLERRGQPMDQADEDPESGPVEESHAVDNTSEYDKQSKPVTPSSNGSLQKQRAHDLPSFDRPQSPVPGVGRDADQADGELNGAASEQRRAAEQVQSANGDTKPENTAPTEPEELPRISKSSDDSCLKIRKEDEQRKQALNTANQEEDGKRNGASRIATISTPTTLESPTAKSPLSAEATQALELILKGQRKRRGARRVLGPLLSGRHASNRSKTTGKPAARQAFFLELAAALTGLARGELSENPGVDPRLWEAVQSDLALKAV